MANLSVALGVGGLLVGALVMLLALSVGRAIGDLRRRVDDLEQQVHKPRHTHRTIAGIEDATANLIAAQIDAEAMLARHATAYRILLKMREGPESYSNKEWDTDKESGGGHG